MIAHLRLENLTVFQDLAVNFGPGINVLIGENGTGKTHLLKAGYAMSSGYAGTKPSVTLDEEALSAKLTTKMLRLYMPLEGKLGKLRRQGASEQGRLTAGFQSDERLEVSFHTNSKSLAVVANQDYARYRKDSVFIPTKEVLSFMEGFVALFEKYGLSFDQSYQDICLLLDLPKARPETLHVKAKWAMTEIEKVCGGKFVFKGGGVVTFESIDGEYSANAMAEGFRKIGMVYRLLETGAIRPGETGPLFWDEPESNMNPKLLGLLVDVLLELARNGQQIILATHEYVLLKWLDLKTDRGQGDQVRYHSLSRNPETKEVQISTTDDYSQMSPNAIDDTFGSLIDQEIQNGMGDLGR